MARKARRKPRWMREKVEPRPTACPGCTWLLVRQGRARKGKLCTDCRTERAA